MKLAVDNRAIERVGTFDEKAFTIKATGKAFKILSSGLYRDKILAIVRELSCNAYDAHVQAGKEKVPFRIHLPNALEPFFSIRDEGVGLSHEDVQTLYTTYFESTKTESNDYVGALGLGSKSPFSYVDSFTVVSYYNGFKRTYTAFLSDLGLPALTELGQPVQTTEPNGLEVIIPVDNTNDFSSFRNKAEYVLEFFEPLPIVTGCQDFKVNKREIILRGKDWEIRNYPGSSKPRAIMGNIAYPIEVAKIDNLDNRYKKLLSQNIDLFFDIGDLDFTAGRETLSYDPKTIVSLTKKASEAFSEINEFIQDSFKSCKTLFDAKVKYNELYKIFPSLFNQRAINVFFNGTELTSDVFDLSFNVYTANSIKERDFSFLVFYRDGWLTRRKKPEYNYSFSAKATTKVVLNDLPRGAQSRIKNHIEKNKGEKIILLDGNQEKIDKVLEQLDGIQIINVSELEKKPSVPKVKTKVRALKMENYSLSYGVPSYSALEQVDADASNDAGFYFLVENQKIVDFQHREQTQEIFRKLFKLKIIKEDETVYFIPKSIHKKFNDKPNWVPFKKEMTRRFLDYARTENIELEISKANQFHNLQNNVRFKYDIGQSLRKLDSKHPFVELCDTIKDYEKYYEKSKDINTIVSLLDIKINHNMKVVDLSKEWDRQLNKYPMLYHVLIENGAYIRYHDSKLYAEYINQIDKIKD